MGPLSPADPQIDSAVVQLHLEPGEEADLHGSARFAGVWMGRMPRITLETGNRLQLFDASQVVRVTCKASGFSSPETDVEFCLLDVWGNPLNRQKRPLAARPVADDPSQGPAARPPPLAGAAEWQPPLAGPGFYRVEARIRGPGGVTFRRQLTLAVIQPERSPLGSEFGWSLPDSPQTLALPELTRLLSLAGIRWVKYPLWCDEPRREAYLDKTTRLSDALLGQEIEMVGLLGRPPEALRARLEASAAPSAAEIFTAKPKIWYPSVETALARLATQVHYWQLGEDEDASFVGYPRLAEQMVEVKRALDRIGQNVSIGFGWNWISPLPAGSGPGAPGGSFPFPRIRR